MTNNSDGNVPSAILSLLSDSHKTVSDAEDDIRGRRVEDSDGHVIGHVCDLLIDEREHKVRFLVLEHGGFLGVGRTKTLIPVTDITAIDTDDIRIDHSEDHVADGPGYDPELMSDSSYLESVCGHYGTTPYWGVGYGYPLYPYHPAAHRSR